MNDISKTIGWADRSWNPITGCLNNCPYCYARKIYKRFNIPFKPQIHYERLAKPLGVAKPLRIFLCSVSDLWGFHVPKRWREIVFEFVETCPQHQFLTLTKQPQHISGGEIGALPPNLWLGVTVTGENDEWRADYIRKYRGIKFVSFEPLIRQPKLSLKGLNWVIIGKMTGPGSKKFAPEKEWVKNIIKEAKKYHIPIFIKDNLKWKKNIQELPNA